MGLDIAGLIHALGPQDKYLFVLIDYYSNWITHTFVNTINTKSLTNFLSEVFSKEGIPSTIITDNDVQFASEEMKNFLADLSISHVCTPLYCPKANGKVERANRLLKESIQLAAASGKHIENSVRDMLWAYHTTPSSTKGLSPFELLRGSKVGSKFSPNWLFQNKEITIDPEEVGVRVKRRQNEYKEEYDKKWGAKHKSWSEGQWVVVRKPFVASNKGDKFYAPEKIKEVKNNVVVLENGKMWSMDRLSTCPDSLIPREGMVNCSRNSRLCPEQGNRGERLKQTPVWHKDYKML